MEIFKDSSEAVAEVIGIIEEIDLEIEEADINEVEIEKLLLGQNVIDKLVAAMKFFKYGTLSNRSDIILEEYRGIPVIVMEDEDKDEIDYIIGE